MKKEEASERIGMSRQMMKWDWEEAVAGKKREAPGFAVSSMASSLQILNVYGQHPPHTSGTRMY